MYFSLVVSHLHSLFGCGDYKIVMQFLAGSQKVALTQVLRLQCISVLAAHGHNDCWCVSEEVEIKTHTQSKQKLIFIFA